MNENAIVKGYITNLGRYNEGDLVYKLISFPISEDELNEALKEIGCRYVDENGVAHNLYYEEFFSAIGIVKSRLNLANMRT